MDVVCDVASQAVKAGGGADPVVNTLLAEAIREASAWGVPKDNIQRTIAKASNANSEDFKETVFEVRVLACALAAKVLSQLLECFCALDDGQMYGHGGVALIVTCLTDSVNRAATMVRTAARDAGARMADPGSVTFQFTRTPALELQQQQAGEGNSAADGRGSSSSNNDAGNADAGPAISENAILELALEQGVDDIQVRASSDPAAPTTVLGEASGLKMLKQALEAKGVMSSLVFTYVPNNLVECSDEDREKNLDLIEDLKQLDDVDSVDHNMQLR